MYSWFDILSHGILLSLIIHYFSLISVSFISSFSYLQKKCFCPLFAILKWYHSFFFFFTKSRWESSQLILTSSSPQLHRKCLGHHPTNDPLRFTICPMQGLFLSFSNSLSCPLQFCPMLAKCHLLYFGSYNYTLLVLFISHCSCVSFKGLYFLLLFHSL